VRPSFARALVELAHRDPRVVLLTGDLGFMVLEPFREAHPDRFFNVGVAEQNMLGVATGLAEAGYIPFAYSIATFASMRPYEFLRNGAILHQLPVRVVGVGAGFDYGPNGVTHYALEDVALMRAQPGMHVIVPADREQAATALAATADVREPIYFRVAKEGAPIAGLDGRFELGRAHVLGDGTDVAFVALGNMAQQAMAAAELLAQRGVKASVAVVASVSPPPVGDLAELLASVPVAVSAEAHYITGGLGSLVAEVIAEHDLRCRLIRCGPQNMPRLSGSQSYLYDVHGLTAAALAQRALAALGVSPIA
jgi:transketolase